MSGRAQDRYAGTARGPAWINSHVRTQLGRPLTRLRTAQKPRTAGPGRPRRRRFLIAAAALLLAVFGAATARLFVWPERGMPAPCGRHRDAQWAG